MKTAVKIFIDVLIFMFFAFFLLFLLYYQTGSLEMVPTEEDQENAKMISILGMIFFGSLCSIGIIFRATMQKWFHKGEKAMKKCTAGMFTKIVVFLVFGVFFLPMAGLFLYLSIFDSSLSSAEQLMFTAGAILFGGLVAFAAYRVFYLGIGWVEYDAETVIFHCSRREQHRFRWEDVPGPKVQAGPWQGGYMFVVLTGGQQRKVGVSRFSTGFKDFERTLESAGVLKRIGVTTEEDFKRAAEQVFSQFERYREEKAGSVRPKPEGDCVPCPDCDGKGIIAKRVLRLDIGKICKTCGGSGYLPR